MRTHNTEKRVFNKKLGLTAREKTGEHSERWCSGRVPRLTSTATMPKDTTKPDMTPAATIPEDTTHMGLTVLATTH